MVTRYASFYLGTHRPRWLEQVSTYAGRDVPLFVSYNTLAHYRRGGDDFPKGLTSWALDSGAFTILDRYGEWRTSPDTYGGAVYRFIDDIGTPPDFCAPQDWPFSHPADTCRAGPLLDPSMDLSRTWQSDCRLSPAQQARQVTQMDGDLAVHGRSEDARWTLARVIGRLFRCVLHSARRLMDGHRRYPHFATRA